MIWSTFTNACCALLKLEYEIEKLKLIVIEFRLRSYLHAHCTKIRPKAVKESIYQAPPYVAQTHKCTKVRTYGKQLIHNYIYVYTSGWAGGTQLVWAVGLTALVPLLSIILICTWYLSNKLSAKLNLLILEAFHQPNYRSKVYEDPLFQAKNLSVLYTTNYGQLYVYINLCI